MKPNSPNWMGGGCNNKIKMLIMNNSKYAIGQQVYVVDMGEFKDLEDGMKLTIFEIEPIHGTFLYSFDESDTKLREQYLSDIKPEILG